MKAFASVSAAVVIGLMLAGAVQASPNPDAGSTAPPAGALRPNDNGSADEQNPHVVTGRVLKVDAGAGTVVIQTAVGVIALRGPREDLRDLKVGDIVQVEMVGDEDYPSASPPMDDGGTKN